MATPPQEMEQQIGLESRHITAQLQDGVLHLTLDRADKLNALTKAMYEDLTRAVEHAAGNGALADGEGDICIYIPGRFLLHAIVLHANMRFFYMRMASFQFFLIFSNF